MEQTRKLIDRYRHLVDKNGGFMFTADCLAELEHAHWQDQDDHAETGHALRDLEKAWDEAMPALQSAGAEALELVTYTLRLLRELNTGKLPDYVNIDAERAIIEATVSQLDNQLNAY